MYITNKVAMHQASNMHNILKIGAWAEPYVNFIYRETPPPPLELTFWFRFRITTLSLVERSIELMLNVYSIFVSVDFFSLLDILSKII